MDSEGPVLKIVEDKLKLPLSDQSAKIKPYNSLENNKISVNNLSVRYREDLP